MEFLKYLLIILPLLVTLIPVVLKTTKEDKGIKHFLNLTTSGVWLVAVIGMLTVVTILYEYFDNENTEIEKAAMREKATYESTVAKLRYDSTQLALKAANDSIKNLGSLNATLLNNDTVHFAATLDKFGEQLINQQVTLKRIGDVLNPLYPLILNCEFTLTVDSLPKEKRQELVSILNALRKASQKKGDSLLPEKKSFNLSPDIYGLGYNIDGYYAKHLGYKNKYDKLFDNSYLQWMFFLEKYLPDGIAVTFYRNNSGNPKDIDLDFLDFPDNIHYSYISSTEYESDLITFDFSLKIEPERVIANVSNINDCKNDKIQFQVYGSKLSYLSDFTLAKFMLGDNYFNSLEFYPITFKNKISDTSSGNSIKTYERLKLN